MPTNLQRTTDPLPENPNIPSSSEGAPPPAENNIDPVGSSNRDEDVLQLTTDQINTQVQMEPETAESFTQEITQQPATSFLGAISDISAPQPFDAVATAQQLQEEQGISSLNEQLNILDAEIADYDARVRQTAQDARNRLVPQSLINRELQQIQTASAEHRGALLRERNFLQNQITSRNNLISSMIQYGQMTYENASNFYNNEVNRYLQLAQLEQNQRLAELDIIQKEVEFARAQGKFTMDFIVQAVRAGGSFDSIPQGLLDNLEQNSIKATGDPNYYRNLAEFIIEFNLSTGDKDANWKSIGTVVNPDGTYSELLLDSNTANRMKVDLGGQPFVRPSTASGIKILTSTNDDGTIDVHVVDTNAQTEEVIPTTAKPKPSNVDTPAQDGLKALTGLETLPTWITEEIASTIANVIVADSDYINIPDDAPRKPTKAVELYQSWILGQHYSGTTEELLPIIFEDVVIRTSPDGQKRAEFTTSYTPEEKATYREWLSGLILRDINKYPTKAEFIEDVKARPRFFREAFAQYLEDKTFIADPGTNTVTQGTVQRPVSVSSDGTATLSNGRSVKFSSSVLSHQQLANQYFPEAATDALAVLSHESGGGARKINTSGEYSVGLFQINLNTWTTLVREDMGRLDATREQMRDWLFDPNNNFRVAAEIYRIAGNSFARDWVNASKQLGLS